MNLKDFIKKIINEKKYKKDQFIKYLLYSLIELYFRQNVSLRNIKLLKIQNYFLKKINNTKIFNLDDETLLMEFDDRGFKWIKNFISQHQFIILLLNHIWVMHIRV